MTEKKQHAALEALWHIEERDELCGLFHSLFIRLRWKRGREYRLVLLIPIERDMDAIQAP
jgi:hypothetical protein